MKRKVNCGELSLEKSFARIATQSEGRLWNMAKFTRKSKFHPCVVFSAKTLLRNGRYVNANFTLSSNNKNELRDLYNYLNQKVITAINT